MVNNAKIDVDKRVNFIFWNFSFNCLYFILVRLGKLLRLNIFFVMSRFGIISFEYKNMK